MDEVGLQQSQWHVSNHLLKASFADCFAPKCLCYYFLVLPVGELATSFPPLCPVFVELEYSKLSEDIASPTDTTCSC